MSDPFDFGPDTGRRELWLFALHVTGDEIDFWEPPRPDGEARDWPMQAALGVGPLDPAHVQLFQADDLGKYGLRRYLSDALGMDEDEVEADAQKLDTTHGTAVIVFDRALCRRPGRFAPERPLRFIGHYRAPVSLTPAVPRPSTRGIIPGAPGTAADGAGLRRGLIITLAGLIGLALVVWALA